MATHTSKQGTFSEERAIKQQSAADVAMPAAADASAAALPINRLRQTFNRLTEEIQQQRETLALWETYSAQFEQRIAVELLPLERAMHVARVQLLKRLDTLVSLPGMNIRIRKSNRNKLHAYILHLLEDSLNEEPDAELEALHDKHSPIPKAVIQQQEIKKAEAHIAELYGHEILLGHRANSADELWHIIKEKVAEKNTAELPELETTKSLRGMYRKLASSLHPDRETCAVERERKTELMQRVNLAYEHNDLLELLTLQIEVEWNDGDNLASMTAEHLQDYITMLSKQLRALEQQIEDLLMPLRNSLRLQIRTLNRDRVNRALESAIADTQTTHQQIADILNLLERTESNNPLALRALINALPDQDKPDSP